MQNIKIMISKIDTLNLTIGRVMAWAVLYMVLVQFAVVILRYVFSISFIATVESVIYAHGLVFMLGAGYTLLKDGHVRVDVFYREAAPRTKAWIDLAGSVLFIFPVMVLILWTSASFVFHSWQVFEGSEEAGGLPLLFLYKTVIWLFAIVVGLQGFAMAGRAWLFLRQGNDSGGIYPQALDDAEQDAEAPKRTDKNEGQKD